MKEEEPESYWNYRVLKKNIGSEVVYEIHECHYENDVCIAVSEDPVQPMGESIQELKEELEYMMQAFSMEVIDWKWGR